MTGGRGRHAGPYCVLSPVLLPVALHRRGAMRDVEEVVRRDVHGADDPLATLAEVEHVDAGGRLLEVAEEHPLAGERVREDRAVDAAVEDGERGVPAVVVRRGARRRGRPGRRARRSTLLGGTASRSGSRRGTRGRTRAGARPPESPRAGRPGSRGARARTPARCRAPRWTRSRACAEGRCRARGRARSRRAPRRPPSPARSPSSFSGTSRGSTGEPSSAKYDTSAWRMR